VNNLYLFLNASHLQRLRLNMKECYDIAEFVTHYCFGLKGTQVISFAMKFAHLDVDVITPQLTNRKCHFADVRT
jgi:hypothetical protein